MVQGDSGVRKVQGKTLVCLIWCFSHLGAGQESTAKLLEHINLLGTLLQRSQLATARYCVFVACRRKVRSLAVESLTDRSEVSSELDTACLVSDCVLGILAEMIMSAGQGPELTQDSAIGKVERSYIEALPASRGPLTLVRARREGL